MARFYRLVRLVIDLWWEYGRQAPRTAPGEGGDGMPRAVNEPDRRQDPAWRADAELGSRASGEDGFAQFLLIILVVLAIIALLIWIVQQLT